MNPITNAAAHSAVSDLLAQYGHAAVQPILSSLICHTGPEDAIPTKTLRQALITALVEIEKEP